MISTTPVLELEQVTVTVPELAAVAPPLSVTVSVTL